MVTRSSSAVEARRKAAKRVQEAAAKTLQATTDAVVAAITARETREELVAALDAAESEFRGSIDKLVKLGKTLEEVAELTDLPISEIRAARRPRGGKADASDSPPAESGPPVRVVPDPPAAGSAGLVPPGDEEQEQAS